MNNDRFKFRVWDNERNSYVRGEWGVLADNGVLYQVLLPESGTTGLLRVDTYRYTIEQCTGLRDRNGKLIYEGDILAVQYGETYVEQNWVLWNEKENCPTKFSVSDYEWLKKEYPNGNHETWLRETTYSGLNPEYCHIYEVIGNIHEVKHE